MSDKTNLTELTEFFGTAPAKQSPIKVVGVPARFWQPGDTYEQAAARAAESMARLQSKRKNELPA